MGQRKIKNEIKKLAKTLGVPKSVIKNALKKTKKSHGIKGNPMPVRDFFNLKKGDKVFIYWAKDDDSDDVRLNGIYKVIENDGQEIEVPDCYFWDRDEIISEDANTLDTSRGIAQFHFVTEI